MEEDDDDDENAGDQHLFFSGGVTPLILNLGTG
jgi:hypothetical protein